ncbi:hypothetical protein [Actinomadura sp. 9N407]|uniref:hypothetical protein n=1 Tax=Actinomadura sp. 9N407 TaxID=3375154 RepID=UPI003792D3F5
MGRHRSDPRGLARILIAVVAVVLALALLVVGGMALVNALTSSSNDPGPAGTAASTDPGGAEPKASASATPSATRSAQTTGTSGVPLVIRVTGAPTQVYVRVTGTGDVLQQGVLRTGEGRQYDQAPLAVVANNGGSLDVVIYGKTQERKPDGVRGEWFVPKR